MVSSYSQTFSASTTEKTLKEAFEEVRHFIDKECLEITCGKNKHGTAGKIISVSHSVCKIMQCEVFGSAIIYWEPIS